MAAKQCIDCKTYFQRGMSKYNNCQTCRTKNMELYGKPTKSLWLRILGR